MNLQFCAFIFFTFFRLASNIETILTEEEISYVDQLKEYLYFTESLRLVFHYFKRLSMI